MAEAPRPWWDQALDLLVYAPVGLALTAAEDLPALVDKGRQRVGGQMTMARMVGQFAVAEGQRQAEHLIRDATRHLWAGPPSPTPRPAEEAAAKPPPPPPSAPVRPSTPAPDLAIPRYDALSASQVVQRLPGLTADELAAVQAYEESHRKRRTVLNRIAQLRPQREA
jgi:hypothetical protein